MGLLPSFAVLRSFEAAAKHQSFTAAAEELRISQAAISRQVREFEELIGTQLFRKEGRGVVLTPAGVALAAELHHGLDRLREIVAKAIGAGATGQTLTVAVLPTFASRWLARRLVGFREKMPGINLVLKSKSAPFDLLEEAVDVAIHFGEADWIGGSLTELCPEDLVAVASPGLIENEEMKTAQDVQRMPLLHLATRRNAWPSLFEQEGLEPRSALTGDYFDQFSTMIGAAIGGLGVAIVPSYLVETELRQGTLVEVGNLTLPNGQYYAVTPNTVANPIAREFCVWLKTEARNSLNARRARLS